MTRFLCVVSGALGVLLLGCDPEAELSEAEELALEVIDEEDAAQEDAPALAEESFEIDPEEPGPWMDDPLDLSADPDSTRCGTYVSCTCQTIPTVVCGYRPKCYNYSKCTGKSVGQTGTCGATVCG